MTHEFRREYLLVTYASNPLNMAYPDYNELEPQPSADSPSSWKSILTLLLMVVLIVMLLRFLMAFIVPLLALVLLIANRDLVGRLFRLIVRLYQDETYKGLLATIMAVFLFTPFLAFLFFRTVYYVFVSPKEEDDRLEIDKNGIPFEERIEDLFREDNKRSF